MNYRAPWWLPGGNLQTIWAALRAKRFVDAKPEFRRERWTTPDLDFVDVDWLMEATPTLAAARTAPGADAFGASASARPLLVVFHGLEGSSESHYAQAFADAARRRGWDCAVPHFRGCSGEINQAPRAYHSGDFEEVDWILRRLKAGHGGALLAVGISLGGNALMRWAGEVGSGAQSVVAGVASVCSPLDLAASGRAIGQGFNRLVYTPMFLSSMVPKALKKLDQYPGLYSRDALLAARNLHQFDNVFTAPIHGFQDADDYWARASAKPHLRSIAVPALLLNALNDPFIPASSLPSTLEVSSSVTLWQPQEGGHVGFPSGPFPGNVRFMPEAVTGFFATCLDAAQ
jgi:uncharacterized protein